MAGKLQEITLNKLDPLQQKLWLYRFAYVQLQPGSELMPYRWGVPFLQQVGAMGGWRKTLEICLPFRTLGDEPVISPSLDKLQEIRRHQPDRPLIFCRTAFEPDTPAYRLRALIRARPLAELLAVDDGIKPLHWLNGVPSVPLRRLDGASWHPLARLRAYLERKNPSSTFEHQEDGQVTEQLNLFGKVGSSEVPSRFKSAIVGWDVNFFHQIAELTGTWYVCARERRTLEWFEMDSRRVLPARFRCWHYPNEPDRRDPQVHFILVPDRMIRFRTLDPKIPVLHLDHEPRAMLYREARRLRQRPRWVPRAPVKVGAIYSEVTGMMRFYRDETAWWSYSGGPEPEKDQSARFEARARQWTIIRTPTGCL